MTTISYEIVVAARIHYHTCDCTNFYTLNYISFLLKATMQQLSSKKLIILYVLIVVILVTFLAAIITIIAKQFAKKISLEGYTAVPN